MSQLAFDLQFIDESPDDTSSAMTSSENASPEAAAETGADIGADNTPIREATFWQEDGWTARVIKNIDDDGWAVEMTLDGEAEPALTGPWTMGRDKKNPKPLDTNAFSTLVKTASEVLMRHQQHQHAMLHKSVVISVDEMRVTVNLDIEADEDNPSARLSAVDEYGDTIAQVQVAPNFALTRSSAEKWASGGYQKPRMRGE